MVDDVSWSDVPVGAVVLGPGTITDARRLYYRASATQGCLLGDVTAGRVQVVSDANDRVRWSYFSERQGGPTVGRVLLKDVELGTSAERLQELLAPESPRGPKRGRGGSRGGGGGLGEASA